MATYDIIQRTEFTGATATVVDFNNVFSSSYQNYLLVIDQYKASASVSLFLRLKDSGGNLINQSEYNTISWLHRTYSTPSTTGSGSASSHMVSVGYSNIVQISNGGPYTSSSRFMIFNPYDSGKYTSMVGRDFNTGEGYDSGTNTGHGVGASASSYHNVQESISGFRLYPSSTANITDFKGTLYGIN